MSRYGNLLAGRDQTIRALYLAVLISVCAALFMGLGWMLSPRALRIHLPPDISSGVILRADQVGKPNVYAFAIYIWQQMNRWETDGSTDYEDKIHMLRHYLTPACFQNRLDDFGIRNNKRELDRRQRAVWEIPGRGFSLQRVTNQGNGSWVVFLDLHIQETYLGEAIKSRYVNYPLRVVHYDVDPEQNPFGLAIDCLADKPRVIDTRRATASKEKT